MNDETSACWILIFFIYIDIQSKLIKTEEHPDIARTLSNMASIYLNLGQKQKALEIYDRVYSREWWSFLLPNLIFQY